MGESYVAGVVIGQMRVNTYLWTFISCCSSGGWAEKLDGQSFLLPCQMELTGSPMPAVAGAWRQTPGNIVARGSTSWHALWPQTGAESLHRQRAGTPTQVQGDKIRQHCSDTSLEFCVFPASVVGSSPDNHGTLLLRAGGSYWGKLLRKLLSPVWKNGYFSLSYLGWVGNIVH